MDDDNDEWFRSRCRSLGYSISNFFATRCSCEMSEKTRKKVIIIFTIVYNLIALALFVTGLVIIYNPNLKSAGMGLAITGSIMLASTFVYLIVDECCCSKNPMGRGYMCLCCGKMCVCCGESVDINDGGLDNV